MFHIYTQTAVTHHIYITITNCRFCCIFQQSVHIACFFPTNGIFQCAQQCLYYLRWGKVHFLQKKHFPLFLQQNTPPFHLLPETYGVLAVDSSNVRCVVEAGYGCWTVTDARMQRCWRCSLDTLVHSKPPPPGYVLSVTSAGWNANTHTHTHPFNGPLSRTTLSGFYCSKR